MTPPFVDKTIYSHCLRGLKGWILNIPTLVEVIDGKFCRNPVPMVHNQDFPTNPWAVFVGKTHGSVVFHFTNFWHHQVLVTKIPKSSDCLVENPDFFFLKKKSPRWWSLQFLEVSCPVLLTPKPKNSEKLQIHFAADSHKKIPNNGSRSSPQVKSMVFHGSFGSTPSTRLWQDSLSSFCCWHPTYPIAGSR